MDEAVARLVGQPDAEKNSASAQLVIDIDPAFPWQITALDGYTAQSTELVQHHQWGVWSGNATLNAAAATFNKYWMCAARRCR